MQKINNNETEEIVPVFKKDNFYIKATNTKYLDLLAVIDNQKIILNLLENKLKHDDTKEKAFNRLYNEMDAIKYDKEFQKIKPFYLDLILLYDRIGLLKFEDNTLGTIHDELLEILSKQNIEIIDTENDILNFSLQKVVDTKIVKKEELDSKVLQVFRDGFICKGKILRVQEVVIGKYITLGEESSDDR